MANFDRNKYNSYIARFDYSGLVDYINSIDIKDKEVKKQIDANVKIIQEQGAIASAMINKQLSDEDKWLIGLNYNRQQGIFNEEFNNQTKTYSNPLAHEYANYLRNIGNTSSKENPNFIAEKIAFQFNDEASYKNFLSNSGFNEDNFKSLGISLNENNGQKVISIDRNFMYNKDNFDALNKGLQSFMTVSTPNAIDTANPNPATLSLYYLNSFNVQKTGGFKTLGYNSKGELITEEIGFTNEHCKALELANKSNDLFKATLDKSYENVTPSTIMAFDYMSSKHKALNDAFASGQLKPEYYRLGLEILENGYKNQLASLSFAHLPEVYMNNPEEEHSKTFSKLDDTQADKYSDILHTALKEGRVSWKYGASEGKTGTFITISALAEEKDKLKDKDYGKEISFFVPGLFDEDAKDAMMNDSEAKLYYQISQHQAFGHDMKLTQGGTLSNFDGEGGADFYENGKFKEHYSPEEVQAEMRYNMLLEAGIDKAKEMLKTDSSGNILSNQGSDVVEKLTEYAKKIYVVMHDLPEDSQLAALENEENKKDIDIILQNLLKGIGANRLGILQ